MNIKHLHSPVVKWLSISSSVWNRWKWNQSSNPLAQIRSEMSCSLYKQEKTPSIANISFLLQTKLWGFKFFKKWNSFGCTLAEFLRFTTHTSKHMSEMDQLLLVHLVLLTVTEPKFDPETNRMLTWKTGVWKQPGQTKLTTNRYDQCLTANHNLSFLSFSSALKNSVTIVFSCNHLPESVKIKLLR